MESNVKGEWGRSPYGKLQDDWPKDENGDFEEPVFLKHCASTDMEDDLLVNMLAAYGIPCIRQYPNNGQLGRVIMGISGNGSDLYVPVSKAEEARTLCEGEVRDEENV